MRRVLIVDDDSKVLEKFKKTLYPICHEWEIVFAVSGKEALALMAKSPFDVVVSNIMHIPEMDGVELLDAVMERYPETVRIIHSEHSDREMVLRSVKSAHQFLMKPCDAEMMKYTIERTCSLRDLLKNETLKKLVTGIKDLPSIPSLYGLIIKEMQSKDASLKKVGYLISQDVSMSAKILQLVNSAFFGPTTEIMDPQKAAVYLGIDTLKALVLSIHVFSSFTEDAALHGFSLAEMWRHSLMTGRLAMHIARTETNDEKVSEEALMAGILHDIGRLIMLKVPRQFKEVNDFIESTGCGFVEAEYAVMKTSHAELGAYLLGLWGIPENVVETVAFHHNPSKLLENMLIRSIGIPDKDTGKTKSSDKDLKLQLDKELLTGFTTLTSVHVANALMRQESSSSGATNFPYIDIRYLGKLNLIDKLPKWAESCKKMRQEDI